MGVWPQQNPQQPRNSRNISGFLVAAWSFERKTTRIGKAKPEASDMSIDVTIESNASVLAAVLGGVAESQIPYATAQALNDVAFMAMREAKGELDLEMDLRNRFSQSGIQVNKAVKAEWPNVYSEVGIEERRSYLIDHVTGGDRKGNSAHGRAVLVDTSLRNPRGKVPKGQRPSRLIKRKQSRSHDPLPFMIFSRRFNNEVLVRRSGKDRYPLEIIYAFTKDVSIKRSFEMDIVVQQEVQDTYERAFAKALQRAMRTAKTKQERANSRSRGVMIDDGR